LLNIRLKSEALPSGKSIDQLIDAYESIDSAATDMELAEACRCADILFQIVVAVFGLVPFDPQTGSGCTMAHAFGVLNKFNLWCQKKSSQRDLPPTSTLSSASMSATPTTMGT